MRSASVLATAGGRSLAVIRAAVQKTIQDSLAGGTVTSIEKGMEDGETHYSADARKGDGDKVEIKVAEDGNLIKVSPTTSRKRRTKTSLESQPRRWNCLREQESDFAKRREVQKPTSAALQAAGSCESDTAKLA
jgi:hypothetical protein